MSVVGRFVADTKKFFRGLPHYLRGAAQALLNLQKYAEEQRAFIDKLDAEFKDSERNQLFLMIGQALSAWATMEEFLVIIVAHLLVVKTQQAGLIMYSILNFNVWLSLIHDLMGLNPKLAPVQTRWNKISERIRKIKDLRDQLAHHSVSHAAEVHLKPSQFDIRQKTKLQRPLNLTEVYEFTQTVVAICGNLERFITADLWPLLSSEEKSAEPAPGHSPKSDSQ